MNPLDILRAIKNPQEFVIKQVGNSNPIINNMIQLAQQGKREEVEKIARNMCNSQGVDFDKEILPLLSVFK